MTHNTISTQIYMHAPRSISASYTCLFEPCPVLLLPCAYRQVAWVTNSDGALQALNVSYGSESLLHGSTDEDAAWQEVDVDGWAIDKVVSWHGVRR